MTTQAESKRRMEIERPIDLTPTQLQEPANHVEFRAAGMGSWVEVRVIHNGHLLISGRTLGEALMVAGALMTGTRLVPLHEKILKRLGRR